jgi:hypothetical protein
VTVREAAQIYGVSTSGCFNDVTELLVPELQRRGRYRTRYPGTTLRESLQEY